MKPRQAKNSPHNRPGKEVWKVRPTTSKALLGLMNHLSTRLIWDQTAVLDLFAGTGSLGQACLERGARHLTAVDFHPEAIRHLQSLEKRHEPGRSRVISLDLFRSIQNPLPLSLLGGQPFELILADPPYGDPRQEGLVERIIDGGLLASGGLLVIEHALTYRRFSLSLRASHELTYGLTRFCIFER